MRGREAKGPKTKPCREYNCDWNSVDSGNTIELYIENINCLASAERRPLNEIDVYKSSNTNSFSCVPIQKKLCENGFSENFNNLCKNNVSNKEKEDTTAEKRNDSFKKMYQFRRDLSKKSSIPPSKSKVVSKKVAEKPKEDSEETEQKEVKKKEDPKIVWKEKSWQLTETDST